MDVLLFIFFLVEVVLGLGSTVIIVAVLFATIAKKIYRKLRYGLPLYN